MATQDIIYEPINAESKDIRLLRLSDRSVQGLPSSEMFHDQRVEAGPVCEIFHASLDDSVQYEALSYSWGDAQLQETILVNGNPTSVTINLARALEDVRLDIGTRILWVDALCIDQKNTVERNHQVRHMGAIYQKAEKVVVWVGRPNVRTRGHQGSILDSWQEMIIKRQPSSISTWEHRENWLRMAAFCELPYWRRLWIVQEVGLASELWVYHGRSCQTWELFSTLRRFAQNMKYDTATHGTLRGIATAISDGLPGRLDQQKEYRQPHWLKELHDTIQHLLSGAESAAKAAWVLYGVFDEFKCWHQLPGFETSAKSDGGAHPEVSAVRTSIGIRSAYDFVTKTATLIDKSYSEAELRLLPDEDFESPLVPDYEAQISTRPFWPVDRNLAEAINSLPRFIRRVSTQEREDYQNGLDEKRDVIKEIVQASEDVWIRPTTRESNITFPPYIWMPGTKNGNPDRLIQLPRHLKEEESRLRTQMDKMKRISEPSRKISNSNENMQRIVLEIEVRIREIEKLRRKIKYINNKFQQLNSYFEKLVALHNSLDRFSNSLKSEFTRHQPAFLLRTLLETCERSLCQNPQDKVYGLLGLASDIEDGDLQVDYAKSMFDLFWDVFELTCKQESHHTKTVALGDQNSFEKELMRFSQLIQRSLGGPFPPDENHAKCRKDADTSSRPTVQLPGHIIGAVLLLDFGDDLSESSLYQRRIETLKQYFRGQPSKDLPTDMVTSMLDQLKDAKDDLLTQMTGVYASRTTEVRDQHETPQSNANSRKRKTRNSQPVLFVESSGLIGLAPYNVRSDDLLVQFSNCDIAAIIRPSADNEDEYMVVRRAVVARRFDEKRKTVSDSSPELFKYAVPDPQSLLVEKLVWLELDAVTLQKLTCPVSKMEYNFDVLAV